MQATRRKNVNRPVATLLDGAPGQDILRPMTLAEHAATATERRHHLRDAVQAGIHKWGPETRRRRVAWWDEPDTRPFLLSIYALGHQAATMGHRDEAVNCIRQLLKLDPRDRLGTEELARTVGLVPSVASDAAAGLRM